MRHVSVILESMWKSQIGLNPRWALRAAQRLVSETQGKVPGRGLNTVDKEFVAGVVEYHRIHGFVTPKQSQALMNIMPKYAGQLVRITNEHKRDEEATREERLPLQETR